MNKKIMECIIITGLVASMITGCGRADDGEVIVPDEGLPKTYVDETVVGGEVGSLSEMEIPAGDGGIEVPVEEISGTASEVMAMDDISEIMSSLLGVWSDDSGNTYAFKDDNSFEGYQVKDGKNIGGIYSLMPDAGNTILTIINDADGSVSSYFITTATDSLTLVDSEDPSFVILLTPHIE